MDQAITVGDLLLAAGVVGGFLVAAFGALAVFAAGMASAPSAAEGNKGCVIAVVGVIVLCASIYGCVQ